MLRAETEATAPAPAAAGETKAPDPTDLLFAETQLRNVPVGSTITYDYMRRSGIEKGPYGPPLNDEIKLTMEPGKDDDTRTVRVRMFSGGHAVPAGPFRDYPGNPILVLFLENHLKGLAPLLEANPRYIKNAIRKGLRENATISPTTVAFKGKSVEGWRVVTRPFEGDPQTAKMRGFETMTYTFVVSPAVPGEIVSIEAQAKNAEGGELLEEKIDYDQDVG